MHPLIVQDSKGGALLTVRVQPSSFRTELVGRHGDALKIRIAAPPVDGAANKELIRFLAGELSIPCTRVTIVSGAGGRRKRVRLMGISAQEVSARMAGKDW